MDINFYQGKKVLVCGAARSGISAVLLLKQKGAHVTLQDQQLAEPPREMESADVHFYLGQQPDDIVTDFDVIVISPGIRYDEPFLVKARAAGIYVIGEFELGIQFYTGPIYAITGTNGKTTTTMLAAHIFSQAHRINMVGNIGIPITSVALNTPDDLCIAEVSSFQLETVDTFSPSVAVVTNLTPDHLDRHLTMAHYSDIKSRIFAKQTEKDMVILNHDNPFTKAMAQKAKSQVIFFSVLEKTLGDRRYFFIYNDQTAQIVGRLDGKELFVSLFGYQLIGLHNIENAIVAVIMALLQGISVAVIEQALQSFAPPEHRLEYVREVNETVFYNDSKATNPESSIKSIDAVMGKPLVLIAGGVLKAVDHTEWAALVREKVNQVVLIGSKENQEKMHNELNAVGDIHCTRSTSLQHAIELAYEKANGGVVLFSPATSSFDMFKDYEDRGRCFKEIVNKLL